MQPIRGIAVVALAVVFSLGGAAASAAQSFERATVEGTVLDKSEAALPGATVTVRSLDTNLERVLLTGPDGRFSAPGLLPGGYEVKVELPGFLTLVHPEVRVQVGQSVSVRLIMQVGNVTEQVTVTGAAPLVESSKSDVSKVIESGQIDNLPINGRNFLDFATLAPGIVFNTSTAISGIGANVAGARSRNGSVMVDGFNNLDDSFTAARVIFSQDAVKEFQVLTLGYAAEFGRASGGIVNAVTKSGTNTFTGRGFGFYRDKKLNARNAFETGDKAGFRRYQWGGIMGGPIRQDKLFFFGSLERQDLTQPIPVTISSETASLIGLPADELGSYNQIDKYWSFLGKFNYNLSANDFFEVLLAHSRQDLSRIFGGLTAPSSGTFRTTKDYLWGAKWAHVFKSGRLLNEFRASYNPRDFTNVGIGAGPRVAISGVATWGIATNVPNIVYTTQGQIIDTLTYSRGKHDLKVGMDLYPVHQDRDTAFGFFGSYSFSSLANFQRGVYNSYSQTFGNTELQVSHGFYALFAQDSIKLSPRLTVNFGLRYEVERQPKDMGVQYPYDWNNIGPRAGFAYDLSGTGKLLLRANVGKFFDKSFLNIHVNTFQALGGIRQRSYSFTAPTQAGAPVYPRVLTAEPAVAGAQNVRLMVEDPSIPESWHSSVELAYAIGPATSITASYLRNDGTKQYVNLIRNRITLIDGVRRRPDTTLGQISVYEPSGVSLYNGMSLELTRRFAHGWQTNVAYTYGVANADSNDFGSTYVDENNRQLDYGPAPDDVRHNLVVNGVYTIPSTALSLGVIYRYGSGRPYSAMAGSDVNLDSVINDRAPGFEDKPFSFLGGSFRRVDLRLSWRARAGQKASVELIGEVFNLFNSVSYLSYNNTWGTTDTPRATFGQPLTAADPRLIQLGARFSF